VDSLKYLTLTIEISKLLVPTPPIFKRDSLGNPVPIPGTNKYEIASGMDNNVSTFRGLFQSFYDAPDGLSEELSEIILAFGFEFVTQKAFILRGGYHMESERKGNRKFFTLGAGYQRKRFGINLSFILPQSNDMSHLSKIYRIGLTYSFFQKN
jgi:hypothetical protein